MNRKPDDMARLDKPINKNQRVAEGYRNVSVLMYGVLLMPCREIWHKYLRHDCLEDRRNEAAIAVSAVLRRIHTARHASR